MNLLLATAFTPDYRRADAYVASLKEHCNISWKALVVGRDVSDYGMPNAILQAGHFLSALPECDTVVFTDADIVMHRPLDAAEIEFLSSLKEGQISACYNKHGEEPWSEEIPMLFPRKELAGYDDVRVFNTGFVAARFETYRALFNEFLRIWPEFDEAFNYYPKIQLCMCAAAHRLGLEWIVMPGHICSHGHFGAAPGVIPSNPPTFNGRVIAFDHRLTN